MRALRHRKDSNRWAGRGAWFLCCAIALLCPPVCKSAQSGAGLASSDVEAAYLYNFGKFVTWPAASLPDPAPFSFCILGDDNFVPTLSSLVSNEALQGHKVVVRRLTSIAENEGCQILFLGQLEDARLGKDLAALQKKPILTVSEAPDFLEHGGMIQFVAQNRRVRFAINLKSAEKAGLALSSQLLKLAVYVNSTHAQEATR